MGYEMIIRLRCKAKQKSPNADCNKMIWLEFNNVYLFLFTRNYIFVAWDTDFVFVAVHFTRSYTVCKSNFQ